MTPTRSRIVSGGETAREIGVATMIGTGTVIVSVTELKVAPDPSNAEATT